ncbi:MAG TPA: serine/threonine-protein kinase [Kofleriaceae bacterium]|jgi:serine/threonine-protein kinase|nr:serine/threonine-protein kinase [Kofleriaceae bacterium]
MVEGTQIGAYRIVKPLGAGGMSEVWVAEHALLGRRAAIKVLRSRLSRQSDIVRRMFNEARIMTAIANPGIVQVFDFGFHVDGSAYIVMELLDGETLGERLARRGPLAVSEALHLVRQVASALRAAHDHGVVHRDLKPENIFLARDPDVAGGVRAKLLDFGIAKLIGDDGITTDEQVVLGTPPFMSPEQCRGAGSVEQRSDVYSLGCVLFTMVTGRPPFDASGGAVLAMHQLEPTPIPSRRVPGLPAVVDHLVLRCMAKHPAERFTAGELSRAIASLLHAPWLESGECPAAPPCAPAPFDATAATHPMEAVRPSLVQRLRRTALVAEIAVLAMVICGMAWLAMVLVSRFAA